MKKCFRLVALCIALALAAESVSACGRKRYDVEDIVESGTLVVLTSAEFPPYEYLDETGVPVGADIEIAQAVADALGVELQVENREFSELLSALADGQGAMAISAIPLDGEGTEGVEFSAGYAENVQYIVTGTAEEEITGADTLLGKDIAVQASTAGDFYATDDANARKVLRYDTATQAAAALLCGEADALIADEVTARRIVANNAETLRIIEEPLVEETYGVAVGKGSDLLDVVNGVLAEFLAEGTIDVLVLRYTS